jgi:hypothetical protein
MKRILAATALCTVLALCLAGCSAVDKLVEAVEQKRTAENTPVSYGEILSAVRSDADNAAYPIAQAQDGQDGTLWLDPTGLGEEEAAAAVQNMLDVLDFQPGGLVSYALSVSMDGDQPYAVGIFMPMSSHEVLIKAALDWFLIEQKKLYPDNEVVQNGEVQLAESGEMVLVLCPNSGEVMTQLLDKLAERAVQIGASSAA